MPGLRKISDTLYQGSYPESFDYGVNFDIVVNVSDCPHGSLNNESPQFHKVRINYWFPQNEWGMFHYDTFYAVKRVLDKHTDQVRLVHCCSGVNRSCKAIYGYLLSHGQEELFSDHKDKWDTFRAKCEGVTVCPPFIEEFLRLMNVHPTYSVGGILSIIMGNNKEKQQIILKAIGKPIKGA